MNKDKDKLNTYFDELLKQLLKEYQKECPENQRIIGQLEQRVWSIYSISQHEQGEKADNKSGYFVKLGAKSEHGPSKRAGIIGFKELGDPLWEAITIRKMPLSTAYSMGVEAKKQPNPADYLKKKINEYYSDKFHNVKNEGGYIQRKKKPISKKPKPTKTSKRVEPKFEDLKADNARLFYASIRALTDTFVNVRLEGIEPDVRKGLVEDFEYEVRATYEDLLKKIRNLRRDLPQINTEIISVTAIRTACETLGIPRPRNRKKVDIKKARSVYKRLAARYHPDRNNGSDKLVKQYHAVNEAWEIVELWNEQVEK